MTRTNLWLGLAGLAAVAATGPAAQEAPEEVAPATAAAATGWTVHEPTEEPRECLASAPPTAQENTRDGETVQVQRGETRLFVFFRPSQGVEGQVTFTGGYPFAEGSAVSLDVDGAVFELFTDGEWAWPENAEADARVVAALKGGSEVVLTGQSARGTVTRDTFSLAGFTRNVEDAQARCAS